MTVQMSQKSSMRLDPKCETCEFEVLVIEDEDLMSALILRYLESCVIPALGVKPKIRMLDRGWDLLQTDLSNVRVAVVDLLLPQVTGIDLIRNFRNRYPNMGIVPISGMATEPMRRNLNEILKGDFHLIEKPLRKDPFKAAFLKAWNYWTPPAEKETDFDVSEPSWNAVATEKNVIKIEKKRFPSRFTNGNGSPS